VDIEIDGHILALGYIDFVIQGSRLIVFQIESKIFGAITSNRKKHELEHWYKMALLVVLVRYAPLSGVKETLVTPAEYQIQKQKRNYPNEDLLARELAELIYNHGPDDLGFILKRIEGIRHGSFTLPLPLEQAWVKEVVPVENLPQGSLEQQFSKLLKEQKETAHHQFLSGPVMVAVIVMLMFTGILGDWGTGIGGLGYWEIGESISVLFHFLISQFPNLQILISQFSDNLILEPGWPGMAAALNYFIISRVFERNRSNTSNSLRTLRPRRPLASILLGGKSRHSTWIFFRVYPWNDNAGTLMIETYSRPLAVRISIFLWERVGSIPMLMAASYGIVVMLASVSRIILIIRVSRGPFSKTLRGMIFSVGSRGSLGMSDKNEGDILGGLPE
jgi:hypothetical protein